jgi:hypothetical protein
MAYATGSDSVALHFDAGIEYRPHGRSHAVDLDAPVNANAVSVGYAICGQPVHLWPETAFDPDDTDLHDACRTLIHAASVA